MSLPDRWTAAPGDSLPASVAPGSLWAEGRFRLRLTGPSGESPRVVEVPRPFALVGRLAGVDVPIPDRAASRHHLYLHLDPRGLFVVDLATRTGTRFDGQERPSGWLRPGQALEVAGHGLELLEFQALGGPGEATEDEPRVDLLADAAAAPLARVILYPDPPGTHSPRTLGSELVFLGRGNCCGVRLEADAARIHCVLIRGRRSAFVVDLAGRDLALDGRPLSRVARLVDGSVLSIGANRFEVRVRPAGAPGEGLATRGAEGRVEVLPPVASEALSPDAQGALLAWMMGQLHAQQGEALRRQAEFQTALTGLVRQMQEDQANLLSSHLDRTDAIHKELAALRGELDRRLGAQDTPIPLEAPRAAPLNLDPSPQPIADGLAPNADAATSWLIGRINQLEEESRTSWRDVLGRLTGGPPRRPS